MGIGGLLGDCQNRAVEGRETMTPKPHIYIYIYLHPSFILVSRGKVLSKFNACKTTQCCTSVTVHE